MDASARVTGLVDELITLFNRHSEDLPDGLFDRRTQFLLNGVPYEEMVGRSPSDPLVLMLTRGPAGYRFALKAILHAVPDARLERGEFASTTRSTQPVLACQCWLSGHFRGTGAPVETMFDVELVVAQSGAIERAAVDIDETALARIREARLRA